MKSISLYVDNGSWLCKVHPFTKLAYIATAISVPLLVGKLSFFAIFIALSLAEQDYWPAAGCSSGWFR